MRRLETIGACGSAESVLGQDAALQPSRGGHVSPHPLTSLPHTTTDHRATTHRATLSPSPTIAGYADVPPVSASPPGPWGSPASHAPLTSEAGGSGTMDSKLQVVRDFVLGLVTLGGAETEQVFSDTRRCGGEDCGVDVGVAGLEAGASDTEEPHRVPIHVQPVSDEVLVGDMIRGDEEDSGGHGPEGELRADLDKIGSVFDTQVVAAYEE
ncbi:hypothetical protein CBR_g17565 [Chara braunii]|uniref:Uncharacterized protein n=1 Tax=Chara braunii TaxID=69332 RepID=A0A388KUW3_CHABU|nr:hypothetical protein CBR_g17565 [Chara braunii]|eukprot:GBG73854.1 hypothetical protein CBR_g17565 [Chara braunii]